MDCLDLIAGARQNGALLQIRNIDYGDYSYAGRIAIRRTDGSTT
jgi:hypothetical protein